VAHGQRHDVLQRLRVIAELQGRGKSTLGLSGQGASIAEPLGQHTLPDFQEQKYIVCSNPNYHYNGQKVHVGEELELEYDGVEEVR